MHNRFFVADNQEVSHQSGASRMRNSICCAVCVAPLLIIGMCFLLAFNEQRAVCDQKAIKQGKDVVQVMGCTDPMEKSGELVMANCDLNKDGLSALSPEGTDFASYLTFVGTGLRVEASMYQCVEKATSTTKKDKVGGGTTTITTYTYSKQWKSNAVGNSFNEKGRYSYNFLENCGLDKDDNRVSNPAWPTEVPKTGSRYAPKVKVGAVFTARTSSVPLNTALTPEIATMSTPPRWNWLGSEYRTMKWRQTSIYQSAPQIGDVKVSFYGNDWNKTAATLLGQNRAGEVVKWTASDSWMCSGFSLSDLRMGTVSKDVLFASLAAEANVLTWILRILGFILMWVAFFYCFGPLEVAADCIPCIGPCLGDTIQYITCCISCVPATACTLGVAGIMWAVMRPEVGIPMLLVWVVVMGAFGYHMATRKKKEEEPPQPQQQQFVGYPDEVVMVENPVVGVAQPLAMPGQRLFMVTCPDGMGPGMAVQVPTPEGKLIQVQVPAGVMPGMQFQCQY